MQELLYFFPRFINSYGLTEFVIDGVRSGIEVDSGAIRHILEQTNELTKLSLRNTENIYTESIGNLIDIVSDLIKSMPPRLRELEFARVGGSTKQGD